MDKKIWKWLQAAGADFGHYVNVSHLSEEQNKGYDNAIIFGIALTPKYLQKVSNTAKYVQNMVKAGLVEEDEFHLTEHKTDALADALAEYLQKKGFRAYSQSEQNILATGYFDEVNHSTPLPHKAIALMAGMGWIGKNNLLVTPQYGCGFSMCSVLTEAPLQTVLHQPLESRCGDCTICRDVCQLQAITGTQWNKSRTREEIVNVHKCVTCLECMVFCPWTQAYMKKNL